ncbi:MAG: hypothetical protein II238_02965 [Alphaproteobacteria bacterium]|nr:hypothetical protein [Alphaproteobacteria bacterium]
MGSTPSAPVYNKDADIAEQTRLNQAAGLQQYANVSSPLGGYSVSVDPTTGQMTINKTLSENSKLAQQQQLKALGSYTGDPTQAANAYYNAQMSYLQPQLDRQVERAESSLTNRGLPLGSNAWNNYMGDIYDIQNRTLSALSDEALLKGQNYQSNILNQAAMLGGQVIDPTIVAGQAGAGLENTYGKQFQNEQDRYKTAVAQKNANSQMMGALGSIGGAALGSVIPGVGTALGASLGGALGGALS